MIVSPILCLTHALCGPDAAEAVIELHGGTERAGVEGLVELIHAAPAAPLVVDAIEALGNAADPIVLDALGHALASSHATVRVAACDALRLRGCPRFIDPLARMLSRDGAWIVRRAALQSLAVHSADRQRLLPAASDPHWRVRHALIQVLRADPAALEPCGDDPRSQGVRDYLRYRWNGVLPSSSALVSAALRAVACWDSDPAVLARNLRTLGHDRRANLDWLPPLLECNDATVRRLVSDLLLQHGGPAALAKAIDQLDEPRLGATDELVRLLERVDHDRIEAVARLILHRPNGTPAALAWAINQAGPVFPPGEEELVLRDLTARAARSPAIVRVALAQLAGGWDQLAPALLLQWLDDADADVQLHALRSWNRRCGDQRLDTARLQRLATSADPRLRGEAAAIALRQGRRAGQGRPRQRSLAAGRMPGDERRCFGLASAASSGPAPADSGRGLDAGARR